MKYTTLIPMVNREDIVIGYKPRDELDFVTDIFRTASLWITNTSGDVLLAQRAFNKTVDPGVWAEAVGGTVEGNDSYQTTIIREAKEEIGLDVTQLAVGPKQRITTPCTYFVQWYKTTINKPAAAFAVQPEEVVRLAWVPVEQLKQELRTHPETYIAAMPDVVRLLSE